MMTPLKYKESRSTGRNRSLYGKPGTETCARREKLRAQQGKGHKKFRLSHGIFLSGVHQFKKASVNNELLTGQELEKCGPHVASRVKGVTAATVRVKARTDLSSPDS